MFMFSDFSDAGFAPVGSKEAKGVH